MTSSYTGVPKKPETSRSIYNSETRAMYTGVLDQNWTINFFRSIGYPIVPSSKIYKDNQSTIKGVLANIINTQDRPLGVLIAALHELHLQKKVEMVDRSSNTQLADINYKPYGGKIFRYLIDRMIGARFYPHPGSEHYKILHLDRFHVSTHINDKHCRNYVTKIT